MDVVRFAVVGCGHIGKRHAEMILRNEHAELVALCDIRPAEEVGAERYDVPFFTSIEDLLSADIPIDVVNICTPNGLHANPAVRALEANHHVVIEKPMALSTKDARWILDTAQAVDRRVFCVMQNRYSPPSIWIKDLLQSGKLGEIYAVQINCYWNRDERYYKSSDWHGTKDLDGGTLFTQFSHFVDLMYWLFGDVCNIRSKFNDFNHARLTDFEDSGIITFDFVRGGTGVLNYSTSVWDENFESSVAIIASNGTVKIGGQYMNEVVYCHVKDYDMPVLPPTNPGNDYGQYKGSAQNHHYVIENIVKALNGNCTANVVLPEEGMKVVEIIERIYSGLPPAMSSQ
jgi:predicted dehydrogenase